MTKVFWDDPTILPRSMSDSRPGFGLDIRFTDHFNAQLVITFNYSAIANLCNLKITRAHAKPSQLALSSLVVAW
jgi:hypothetical protein